MNNCNKINNRKQNKQNFQPTKSCSWKISIAVQNVFEKKKKNGELNSKYKHIANFELMQL